MLCEECKRLDEATANALRSLQEQSHVNRQWGIRGKAAKQVEQDLERAYKRARAKANSHKATCPQIQGYRVTVKDLDDLHRE